MGPRGHVTSTYMQINQVSIVAFTIWVLFAVKLMVTWPEKCCLLNEEGLPEHSRPFLPLPAIALSLALRLCHPPPGHRPDTKPLLPQPTFLPSTTTPSITKPSPPPEQTCSRYIALTHSLTHQDTYQKSIIMQIIVKTRRSTPLLPFASSTYDLC